MSSPDDEIVVGDVGFVPVSWTEDEHGVRHVTELRRIDYRATGELRRELGQPDRLDGAPIGPLTRLDASPDKGYYVRSAGVRASLRGSAEPVPVASPPVTDGLGREHIERRRVVPPPAKIGLGDVLAQLVGARVADGGETGEDFVYRPNRAERRAAAKRMRRRG